MRAAAAAAMIAVGPLAACVTAPPLACTGAGEAKTVAELYLGRTIRTGGTVGEAAFRRFLDEEVTPRLPNGFTVLDGRGQWRERAGSPIIREATKVLVVALADARERERLDEVAQAYKARFDQKSVLTISRPACVAF
jgi:hypothetical protein